MEQGPDPDAEGTPRTPIPPDAPVETPEADPRTPGAPDPQGPGSDAESEGDDGSQEVTEEIRDAFS